ncbi:MAG: fibronectin type III domain-containing protein, partial [Treponema sp.]|nr:fibronectin type III domain-containing protein [Treponema sp.]
MKKRMLVVLFTLFAAFAVFSEEAQLPRLAVVEFAVNDIQNTKLVNDSVAVRNQVQSNIVKTGRYDVIARAEIDQLLKEQEIQASSISSKENLKKLKLQNIDYIITGTVDAMDNDYLVSISLLDVGTGKFAHSDEEFMGNSSASLYKGTQVLVSRFVGELKDSGTEITSEKKRVRKEATIATGIHIETGLGGILFMYDSSGWGEWKELSALWDNDAYDILIERPGTYRLKLRLANGSELFRTVEFAIRGVVNVDFTLPPEDFMIDSITGTTATLSWTPSNNSSGYEIRYYNAESVDNPLTVKDISKDTGKYVIKDLKPNMNYSFCLYSKEYSIYSVPAVINKNTSDLKLNDV